MFKRGPAPLVSCSCTSFWPRQWLTTKRQEFFFVFFIYFLLTLLAAFPLEPHLLLFIPMNSTNEVLTSGHLNIETSNRRKRSGDDFVTITGLAANTAYIIRIFVSPETVGLFLQVTTAPTGKFLSLTSTFDRVGLIHKL